MIDSRLIIYCFIMIIGVFVSSISQVLLKKSSQKNYETKIREYLNLKVIIAYTFFFAATLLSIYAYRVIPLSLGVILETTGYIFVTFFSVMIFKEKLSKEKVVALTMIIAGIMVYSLLG